MASRRSYGLPTYLTSTAISNTHAEDDSSDCLFSRVRVGVGVHPLHIDRTSAVA